MKHITDEFKNFVNCSHGDIEYDDHGCNECKLCGSSSLDRGFAQEIMENFRNGMNIKRQKKYRFTFDYEEYTTPMYNFLKRRALN